MPIIGTNLAQSVAGAPASERAAKPPVRKQDEVKKRARDEDEALVHSDEPESAEAVRSLKGNDQEESNQDRRQHPGYTPNGVAAPGQSPPRLDLNA
jgi:hypothetical protein